ncbi:MAG: PilZ domain-containing protein [Spirochaetia bacterium]
MWLLLQTSAAGRFSREFRETTGDFIVWILIIAGLLILITIPFVVRKIASKRKEKEEHNKKISRIKERRKIGPDLEKALSALAGQSDRDDAVLQVLTDSVFFKGCARKLFSKSGEENVSMEEVNRLRFALGFVPEIEGRQLYNTAEIDPDREMKVSPLGFTPFPAVLKTNTPQGFTVKRQNGDFLPGKNNTVTVEFARDEGIYRFETKVLSVEDGVLLLEHREIKGYSQNRKYFRKELDIQVNIRLAGSSEPYAASRLIDLSGGGCSIENPGNRYRIRDDIEIKLQAEEPIVVTGEVVRISGEGKYLHLSFHIIKDRVRDRIIGFLLQH